MPLCSGFPPALADQQKIFGHRRTKKTKVKDSREISVGECQRVRGECKFLLGVRQRNMSACHSPKSGRAPFVWRVPLEQKLMPIARWKMSAGGNQSPLAVVRQQTLIPFGFQARPATHWSKADWQMVRLNLLTERQADGSVPAARAGEREHWCG